MRRTDDVSLWPWHLTLEVTAIVGHTRLGTLSEYTKWQFRSMAHMGQTYHVTLTFNHGGYGDWLPVLRVYVLHPHTNFEVRRPYSSEDMAHNVCQH